jgi:hypothetical protein
MNPIIDTLINTLASFIVFLLFTYEYVMEALHTFNFFWVS